MRALCAFMGGIDLTNGRYDTAEHPLFRTNLDGGVHSVKPPSPPFFPSLQERGITIHVHYISEMHSQGVQCIEMATMDSSPQELGKHILLCTLYNPCQRQCIHVQVPTQLQEEPLL